MGHNGKLGVSPAFFISRFNFDFDAAAAMTMVPMVAQLEYGAVQGEIAAPRFLSSWLDGGIEAFGDAAGSYGLQVRQFVLHYLLEVADDSTKALNETVPEIRAIGERLHTLPGCDTVTIPVGPSSVSRTNELRDYIERLLPALPPWIRIALEALPGSPIATPAAMVAFLAAFPPERVGVNLDTGHLWSQGISPEIMAGTVGAHRVFGTHICDNDGSVNDSLGPGRGTIDWPRFFFVLHEQGYDGPIDMEIRVPEASISSEYAAARSYIESIVHSTQP